MSTYENVTPEFNGVNTRASRRQGLSPKNKTQVNHLPLIDAQPSDPSTILTSTTNAQRHSRMRKVNTGPYIPLIYSSTR